MDIEMDYGYLGHLEDQVYELKSELKKSKQELLDFKKVAQENADIANDRAQVIVSLSSSLIEIVEKWVPALLRDSSEADKTNCNANSIRSVIVRALPGRNFK